MNLRAREALHLFEQDTYVTATLKRAPTYKHRPTYKCYKTYSKKEFYRVAMSTAIERALNHCSNIPFSETENLVFPRSGWWRTKSVVDFWNIVVLFQTNLILNSSYLREFPPKNREGLHSSNVLRCVVEVDDPIHQDAPAFLPSCVLCSPPFSFPLLFPREEAGNLVLVFCFSCLKENPFDRLYCSKFLCWNFAAFSRLLFLCWPVYVS